jgi:HrpA-like helicases
VLRTWLTPQQHALLDKYAPEHVTLPKGRKVKIVYSADGAPTMAARIQDLYGVTEGFFVADRRVPVVIQILAPNNRPVQVTQNLRTFWSVQYPKLKQELQRKYPKHEWR